MLLQRSKISASRKDTLLTDILQVMDIQVVMQALVSSSQPCLALLGLFPPSSRLHA